MAAHVGARARRSTRHRVQVRPHHGPASSQGGKRCFRGFSHLGVGAPHTQPGSHDEVIAGTLATLALSGPALAHDDDRREVRKEYEARKGYDLTPPPHGYM